MILKFSDNKLNTKTRVEFKCDNCGKMDSRLMVSHNKLLKNNKYFDKDYCQDCWRGVRQKTPDAKKRMSNAINNMIKNDPDWKIRNSNSKKGKINIGEKKWHEKIRC